MQSKPDAMPAQECVPKLAPDLDPGALSLTPAEGYLLSRVDGRTPWKLLREIGGLSPEEVDRCLQRWMAEGLLQVPGARAEGSAARDSKQTAEPPPRVDAKLQMPVEVQRRVLEFETRLGKPYHEILGVAPNAATTVIKKAYFGLSKEFHPDRYFRREIGPFAKRLERIFKKIVEAYELLSDPTARAELERSLAPAAAPAAESAKGKGGPVRKPHAFSLHRRAIAQRKLKAKRLFEAGTAAFGRERWIEAAGSVRLAIAFDPWNEAYKERFVEIQLRVHQERAKELVARADDALDLREFSDALELLDEALQYRPHDPDLLHRAARLSWVTGGDLHKAKAQAQESCELEPDNPRFRRTLGQVYKAAGLHANARRELETALRLDPNDQEAEQELRSFGRGILSSLTLGGKR